MTGTDAVLDAIGHLSRAEAALNSGTWTRAECDDQVLGTDMDALHEHIDHALGRASTVIWDMKRINKGA